MDGVLQQEQLIAVRKECTGNPGSTWPGPARLGMYMCMSMMWEDPQAIHAPMHMAQLGSCLMIRYSRAMFTSGLRQIQVKFGVSGAYISWLD